MLVDLRRVSCNWDTERHSELGFPSIAGVSAIGGAACLVLGGICFWVGHERRAVRG